jgi:hypothetical protein
MPLTFRLYWSRQTPARNNSSTIERSLKLSGGKLSSSVTAEEVFKNIGLVLAGIVALPLVILMALSGWDGC